MAELRIVVRMMPRLVAVHELIFRTASQSGLFSPPTRALLTDVADDYSLLRLAMEEQKKHGTPIPPEARTIGFDETGRSYSEIEKRLGLVSGVEHDEGGAGWGGSR